MTYDFTELPNLPIGQEPETDTPCMHSSQLFTGSLHAVTAERGRGTGERESREGEKERERGRERGKAPYPSSAVHDNIPLTNAAAPA